MIFQCKNTLLPHSWFELKILDTLYLYDHKQDISNSPLIQFMREWETTGGMHIDCYGSKDYEEAIHKRQDKVIELYESIKKHGYINEKPILVFFDSNGYMTLYDGHHRLSILIYLGLEVGVAVSTVWKGVDGAEGKDFPLFETIEKIHGGKRTLYQWMPDKRLRDLPCSRSDSKARLDYILKHLKGDTVLDIGCSEGYFSHELAKRGYTVTGVDTNNDLVSIARYLATIQGIKVDFKTADWRDILRNNTFDNILYFSVLHNTINAAGEKAAFDDLELFRSRVGQLFVEIPHVSVQKDWEPVFGADKFDPALEFRTKLNIQQKWVGYRPIYLLNNNKKRKKRTPKSVVKSCTTYDVKGIGPMYFPDNDYVTSSIFKNGEWEPKTTRFIEWLLRPGKGKTFVDVGAQAGYYSLLATKMGARVYAFEPSTSNRKMLEESIALNNAKNITVYKAALSDKNGEAKLYNGKTPGENSLNATGNGFEIVSTVRFDDLEIPVPDIIKIDVEGAERQVLEGMQSVLNTKKEVYLIIEDWQNTVTDWLIDNYGFQLIATERAYGNRFLVKNAPGKITATQEPIRIHLLGPFNTPTTMAPEGLGNAFASKVVRMAKILKRLGHYVIFYGVEGSTVECDEFVQVSTRKILEETYGKWDGTKIYGYGYHDLAHRTFNENAIREINQRRLFGDFLLCCFGTNQKEIADAVRTQWRLVLVIQDPLRNTESLRVTFR